MDRPVPSSRFKVQGWEAGSQGAALLLLPIRHSTFGIRNFHRSALERGPGFHDRLALIALPRPWPVAERGAGAGPKRAGVLPFETEFRTGKVKAGFCGICLSKSLEESRIGNGVRSSSQNRSSGRESALILPGKSEPPDGRVAQVARSHRPAARSAGVLTRSGSNSHSGRQKHAGILRSLRFPLADVAAAGEDTRAPGTWATRPHVGCYGKWRFASASKVTNRAALAAPFGPGLQGKGGQGAPVRHSVPNGENGGARPPSELSSEGYQNAVVLSGPGQRSSAGFQTCRAADFQVGWRLLLPGALDFPAPCRFGNRRYGRFGNLRYGHRPVPAESDQIRPDQTITGCQRNRDRPPGTFPRAKRFGVRLYSGALNPSAAMGVGQLFQAAGSRRFPAPGAGLESPANPQAGKPALRPPAPGSAKPTSEPGLNLTINHQLSNHQPSVGPIRLNQTKSNLIKP